MITTVSGWKLFAQTSGSDANSSFVCGILAKAGNALKLAFSGKGRCAAAADGLMMKNFNGSDCTFNQKGLITEFKDSEGRSWKFSYLKEKVVLFHDPSGNVWRRNEDGFLEESGRRTESVPQDITINHTTGEITIIDELRGTTYRPDGSTQIRVRQERGGELTQVTFTEHATRPHRAFVVVEERDGKELVTWVQDANAKLFKFEYDTRGNLARYIDVSNKPPVIWTAERSASGQIIAWNGIEKTSGAPAGTMSPVMEAVDLSGNRHFVRNDGVRFIVGPSGAACLSTHLADDVVKGKSPVVTFATFPTFSPER